MTSGTLDSLLRFAHPGSGKSERRRCLVSLTSGQRLPDFGGAPSHRGLQETFQPMGH
jgi:hypothetical protein